MEEAVERGAAGGRAAWKLHIIRQLRHRDRSQHGAFLELIQSYNKLLEKSVFLKDLTEKIQTDPMILPAGRHAAGVPAGSLCTAGSEAPPTVQIAELRAYNGELAFQACELKKEAQRRDEELRQQRSSVSFLSALAEDHGRQCQRLESAVAQMLCANADVKEDYDRLLARRRLVEGRLHIAEEQGRELLEELTKKKALEAERQNNVNERRRGEMFSRMVRTALCKTLSAEGDFSSWRNTDGHDSKSLEMTEGHKMEKPAPKKSRSQSMIALGPSRVLETLRSLFELRRRPDDCGVNSDWYHPSSVCVFCSPPNRALCSKEVHESEIDAVKFSPNSRIVATGGADRVVKIWDIVGGQLQCRQVLHGSNGGITSIELDPSVKMTGHTRKVTAARFKMSTSRAVTSSMDRSVMEWDLHAAACIRRIPVPSYCSDVVCSDSYMVSGHHDKKIRFWDSRSQHCIREVTLEEKVTSLFMEPEQTQLLSCSRDDALSLIDLRMGSVRLVFRADGFKCGCDWTKAILSPDASYSMAGSSDGTIFIWSTRTGVLERSLTGEHSVAVNAVAWSVSGEYVVSVDRGKKAVLWSEY
ncbi:protein Atg16l2 isoform X2 [Ranitomeya imitator]|uniref:protein Atg16l2 isoform X2 n=1 Tax=Ranitomeya imitator TaxID=111125 RepID=UPI0037E89546